ncbi:MAG: BREX-1 system adenine-specific DNA-methyltransferase PglX, partial [Methanobacteriaceae archaeon]|nr:BREX-1 system adenine-specific DNA-methyltransferase PglX [Methanobacteriaceae archaeon]
MNKKAIKTFAIESRNKLIEEVKYQASLLGITAEDITEPVEKAEGMEIYNIGLSTPNTIYDEAIEQRESLVKQINEKGFDNVVGEVAYTWFNRIIAIRFMEVNDYLPTRIRVLSSATEGKIEPDIVTESPNIDLDLTDEEIEQIYQLKNDNKLDELFKLLFIKQCNKLNEILPELFEKTADYTELLLSISFTNEEGVVRQLIDNISEENFMDQVEIIGWLYQYYISERKDQVININKGSIKKEDIPAATQLFTPEWIVKYMVDNSLGRYWIERNPHSKLKDKLEYYLEEAEQSEEVNITLKDVRTEITPENISFIDPCMGSGHILVYAFDVFVEIYKERGYSEREIPELILKNNIYGLDIDDRAYQLAYFAVMMKARSYSRRVLSKKVHPNVFSIQESEIIDEKIINYIANKDLTVLENLNYLKFIFSNVKEFGSLIEVKSFDYDCLESKIHHILNSSKNSLNDITIHDLIIKKLIPLINQAKILSKKYDIVVTNPPYLNKMDKTLKDYTKSHFKDYSKDLFTIFIYRNFKFCKPHGYSALMSPFVWMFIQVHEKLRNYIINKKAISSLIQLEYSAFSEATVPICTFVLYNADLDYKGTYLKLSEFKGGMEIQNEKVLDSVKNNVVDYKYSIQKDNFSKIPGSPIAYWVNDKLIEAFVVGKELSSIAEPKNGLQTGDNKKFLRYWYEVSISNIGFGYESRELAKVSGLKWFPTNKGGKFRKWYGNHEYLINWENDGKDISHFKGSVIRNPSFYFKKGISWTVISSSNTSFRYSPGGFIYNNMGPCIHSDNDEMNIIVLGILNSKVSNSFLSFLSPTLGYESGSIAKIPIIISKKYKKIVYYLVVDNINLSKDDWDYFETSWDFLKHPLITFKEKNSDIIKNSFKNWEKDTTARFSKLKQNEESLNLIINEIYGLQEEIDNKLNDAEITINKSDLNRDIKSFISYAVGCMLGRYSLDEEGLIHAGGQRDPAKYSKFIPDDDNIIPILDTEYFEDDIVGRFVEFVKVTFGEETLEENLDFIAKSLKKKGQTSREIIR